MRPQIEHDDDCEAIEMKLDEQRRAGDDGDGVARLPQLLYSLDQQLRRRQRPQLEQQRPDCAVVVVGAMNDERRTRAASFRSSLVDRSLAAVV